MQVLGLSFLTVIFAAAVAWFFAAFVPEKRAAAIDGWRAALSIRADVRRDFLDRIIKGDLSDVRMLAVLPDARALLSGDLTVREAEACRGRLREVLTLFVAAHAASGAALQDAAGGLVVSAGRPPPVSRAVGVEAGAVRGCRENVDFVRDENGRPLLVYTSPIVLQPDLEPSGCAAVALDPENDLYPLLSAQVVPGRTSEALLIQRGGDEILFLSRLRHRADAPLTLRLPLGEANFAARQALEGKETFGAFVDYRGAPVFGAVRRLKNAPWGLVVKIDEVEALSAFRKDVLQKGVTWGALLVALLAAAAGFGRSVAISHEVKLARVEARSRALMQDVLDHGATLVYIVDLEGRFLLANRALESVLGVPREKILGRAREAFMPEQIAAEHRKNDLEVIAGRQSLALEETNEEPDGRHVYSTVKFPLLDAQGTIYAVAGMSTDITGRRRAEDRIHHLNRLLRTISEINQLIVHVDDRKTLIGDACRVLVEHGGFRMAWIGFVDPRSSRVVPEARAGDGLSYLDGIEIRSDDMPLGRGPAGTAIRTGNRVVVSDIETDPSVAPWRDRMLESGFRAIGSFPLRVQGAVTGALTVYRSDLVLFSAEETALLDELAGEIGYALEVLEIRVENRRAEEALTSSEERFRIAAETSNDVIYEWDLKDRVDWFGDIDGLLGYGPGEFPRTLTGWSDFLHPEDRSAVMASIQAHLDGRAPYIVEYRVFRRDGGVRWWSARGAIARTPDGVPFRWVGTVTDITERKQADEALRTNEARLRLLFDGMLEGYAHCEMVFEQGEPADWVYLDVNPAFERVTGLKNAVGKRVTELIPGIREANPELFEIYGRVASGGEPAVFEDHIPGLKHWFAVSAYSPTRGEFVAVFDDITERKSFEASLRESEDKFKYIFEHSVVAKSLTLPSGVVQTNRAFAQMLGYSLEELREQTWKRLSHPDDAATSEEQVRALMAGEKESARFTKRYIHKNGSVVWGDVATSLRRDSAGQPLYFMTTVNDVTERKRAEEEIRLLNEQLETRVKERTRELEAAKNEMEAFSYSVSHDLRAPLRAMDGFSRILLEDYESKLDSEGKRLLGVVRTNTVQMANLIDDLLSFSRIGRQEMVRSEIDMEALAKGAFRELGPAGDRVSFIVGPLPRANGDPSLMRQVFLNLISNALKFTGPKAQRAVEVGARIGPDRIVYGVRDNGVGFDMTYADKLFGVFQRLHSADQFEGTGVGLALVQRIVHRHGGEVWAEGKVGEGATFSFSLPLGGGA